MEGSILASRNNGREAVLLIQYAKGIFAVESIDDVKELVETGNQVSNESPVSGIEMPGLTGVEAYTCDMVADGVEVEACAVYGESAYAYYSFMYLGNRVNDKKMEDVKEMCASYKETVPESALPTETIDTVLWINGTHALLTALNGWDYTMYGGMAVNDTSMALEQQMLEEWWSVTDRQTADENLDWLLNEVEDVTTFEEVGIQDVPAEERAALILENYIMTEDEAAQWAEWYNAYEQYGENALAGWDYSRAMSVLSNYYVAGYYTQEEALDKSLEVAATIQASFDSWEAFMESYFLGYEYWAEESSDERRAVYEEIKQASDSPYNLDWNLTLEKTW